MSDDEKPAGGTPMDDVKAYFKSVSWLNTGMWYVLGQSLTLTSQLSFHIWLPSEVIAEKNLGEYLNTTFADRQKMEAVPFLQNSVVK